MAQRLIQNLEELKKMVGQEVGVSDWHRVTQEAINMFADATLDHQWIHIDPAERDGNLLSAARLPMGITP